MCVCVCVCVCVCTHTYIYPPSWTCLLPSHPTTLDNHRTPTELPAVYSSFSPAIYFEVKWSESCSVLSDSLWPHGLYIAHGILQDRILEWVAFPFRESSQRRDWTQVFHKESEGRFFTSWATREAQLSILHIVWLITFNHNQTIVIETYLEKKN